MLSDAALREEDLKNHSEEPVEAMMNTIRSLKRIRRFKKYNEGERGKTSTDRKEYKIVGQIIEPNANEKNGNEARPSQSKNPRFKNDQKGKKSLTKSCF